MRRYGCSEPHLERRQLAGAVLDDRAPARVAFPGDDVLDGRRLLDRLLDGLAHRQPVPAAERVVRGDHDLGLRVLQPLRHGRRGEAGEERHLDRADVRARVRCDRNLGAHGQVDGDPVAGLDPESHEALREPRHVPGELRESQLAPRSVLACEDGADLVGRPLRPAVDAVAGDETVLPGNHVVHSGPRESS